MDIKVRCVPGEERDGFYVQPLMKRIWAMQLDILQVIDDICKRHGIKYCGWYGTVLGAVRHHGFIPWDDDIDVAMLREDYERFQYFARTELPDGWKILELYPTLIRVMNTDVIRLEQDFLDKSHGCPFAVGIDIFCLDHIPLDKADEGLWLDLFWKTFSLYTNGECLDEDAGAQESNWERLREIERFTGHHFDRQSSMKGQLYALADKIAAMYWNTGSDDVTFVYDLYQDRNYRIPTACFDRMIEVPFEDRTIPILEDYDLLCRLSYGDDYMTPIKCPVHSGMKVQIDILREYFEKQGKTLPEYFDMSFE